MGQHVGVGGDWSPQARKLLTSTYAWVQARGTYSSDLIKKLSHFTRNLSEKPGFWPWNRFPDHRFDEPVGPHHSFAAAHICLRTNHLYVVFGIQNCSTEILCTQLDGDTCGKIMGWLEYKVHFSKLLYGSLETLYTSIIIKFRPNNVIDIFKFITKFYKSTYFWKVGLMQPVKSSKFQPLGTVPKRGGAQLFNVSPTRDTDWSAEMAER